MLDLAKIEAASSSGMQRVSASELAREAATALGQLFRDKSVELKMSCGQCVDYHRRPRSAVPGGGQSAIQCGEISPRDAGLVTLAVETNTGASGSRSP
jgi:hypothetical protein